MSDALVRTTESILATAPRPAGLTRAISGAFVQYRVVMRAPVVPDAMDYRGSSFKPEGSLASPEVLEHASALGLRFVGVYAYLGLFSWIPREGWVSEDGAVRLSARRGVAAGLEGMMSSYYLSTTFEDGTVLLTWAKSPPPLPSTTRTESLGGKGDLAADLATHRAAIARRAPDAPPPVHVVSADDCVALSRYYDRFLTTDAQLANVVWGRVVIWGGLASLVSAVVWLLVRLL